MEILVCIKQVPDDSVEISLDEATGKPALDGVTPIIVDATHTHSRSNPISAAKSLALQGMIGRIDKNVAAHGIA